MFSLLNGLRAKIGSVEEYPFAHPLELVSLENLKNKISSDEGFAEVRKIALIIIKSAIENAH